MNAQLYWNITSRLAYYDSMKANAPRREVKDKIAKPPRRPLARMPKRRSVVLLPTEDLNA
jgi:hypothetical protein